MSRKSLQSRIARSRRRTSPEPAPAPDPKHEEAMIRRIDALTDTGRINWLALNAYLAFALITTLSVEDVDFFVDSRQTKLPLVDVTIPTFSFFVFAPILGAALYVYLHLHIRKLTEALASTPAGDPPLEERIKPWLLNDFVLRQRCELAVRSRPMDWLVRVTTVLLVWWSGPMVLGIMWVRTWPAHELWMSLLSGLCLSVSIYAGTVSYTKMRRDLKKRRFRSVVVMTVLVITSLPIMIWLTLANSKGIAEFVMETPSPIDQNEQIISGAQKIQAWSNNIQDLSRQGITPSLGQRLGIYLWNRAVLVHIWANVTDAQPNSSPIHFIVAHSWTTISKILALSPPNLSGERLSILTPENIDYDVARARYRIQFCDRREISFDVCEKIGVPDYLPLPSIAEERQQWCFSRGSIDQSMENCDSHLWELDEEFEEEWRNFRRASIDAIIKPDLRAKDLRRADLSFSELSGVNFLGASLDEIIFRGARLEGANFVDVSMREAHAEWADMQAVNLAGAYLQRTTFSGAQMQAASLDSAYMQYANFSNANMLGASISWAELHGANFEGAQLQSTNFSWSIMPESNFRLADLQNANFGGSQMTHADLSGANIAGANFIRADLRAVNWDGSNDLSFKSSPIPVYSADFRGGINLTQSLLTSMVGNERTLLPVENSIDTGEKYFVPSCWVNPLVQQEEILAGISNYDEFNHDYEISLRELFLCAPGAKPERTGTPWPLDQEPPWETDPGCWKGDWEPYENSLNRFTDDIEIIEVID